MTWRVVGRVEGMVRFPEHPQHVGHLGLEGGEDVAAERSSFRSVGEAMTWCRKVLDGQHHPRWEPYGDLQLPHTDPSWSTARVEVVTDDPYEDPDDAAVDMRWETYDGTREWTKTGSTEVARTDPPKEKP